MMTRLAIAAVLAAVSVGAQQAPPAPPRPRIVGISHVAIRVTDAAAARKFYGQVLGLPDMHSAPDKPSFEIGRNHVVLLPGLPAAEDERFAHVAFETTDLAALRAHFTARGVPITQPAEQCRRDAITVQDADGHPIEFVQVKWPPDPGAPRAASGAALSTRLLHAGLVIADEERAHRFYRDVLGFAEIWRGGRTEGVASWVNMRVPDGTQYLEYMLAAKPPDRRQRGSMHHICLVVPEVQPAWELAAARADPATRPGPPNVGVNGKWQLNLFDPDGTRVELMEPFRTR